MENSENTRSGNENNIEPAYGTEVVNPRLSSATGGIAYSASVIVFLVVSLLASLLIFALRLDSGTDAYVYISYLASPIAIGASVLTVLKVRKVKFKEVFPVKCKPKYYLIGILLIFGLLFSLSWVNNVAVAFFNALFGYEPKTSESYFPDMTGGMIVPALLVIAVMPALFEELLFRGVLLNCCEKGMGSVRAVLVVGFCFSLFHASPEQTVYQFLAGCAFALIAVRSRSILPSVMMHFINNALIVVLQAANVFDESGEIAASPIVLLIIMALSFVSLVTAFVLLMTDKTPLEKCKKGGVKNFFVCAAAGIAVLGVIWILSLFGIS